MSLSRVLAIASNVFREVIRDRVLYLIGFYALVMAVALRLLPEVAVTAQDKVILDVGLAASSLLGLLVAVFIGTGLVSKEIEKRTVLVLIAKPVSRMEFMLGKHLGLSAVLAVLVVAMTAINLALLEASQIEYPLVSLLVSAVYSFLELMLITAVAIAFGVFTSSILASLLTLGVYLMGHSSRDLLALGRLTESPGFQQVTQAAYLILPDLSRLTLRNDAVYGVLPGPETLALNAVYAFVYTALLLLIAGVSFARREF
ncbi:ABC transporter permease [Geitlerinema sp. PCC 7407]|uniref:ABC transporter permease n=1 Tax=Geitlerinema sp. PCC 7407 TaxID=1173025 RepID=UPI00029FE18C|nr:ABC transporter permease [Geitlerinema sp. PCC 7407]AFY67598.1 putative efflux ABC transporter, permease protein PilI [Geitlerinema sp. PCC 7407]